MRLYRFFSFIAVPVLAVLLSGCSAGTGDELLAEGMDKLEQGQYEQAASLLEQAAIKLPSSATAQCNLGIAYWKLNSNEDAVAAFRKAAELNPQETVPLEYIARVLKEEKDLEGARSALKEAGKRLSGSGSPRILTAIAVIDLEQDNTYAAYDFLMQSLEADPDYPPALYNLARLYREKLKNYKMAARFYGKYIKIASQSVSEEERAGFEARVELAKRFLEGQRNPPPPPVERPVDPPLVSSPKGHEEVILKAKH